jgi:hypothetical protein
VTLRSRVRVFQAYLRALAVSHRPILVGPWRSEVGFESLYWLPFLRRQLKLAGIDPKRLIPVTRGGAACLYGMPGVDLYQLRTVEMVRLENGYQHVKTGLQKQTTHTSWDRQVLRDAADVALGKGEAFRTISPSWVYWCLAPWWDGQAGLNDLLAACDFTPIAKPQRAVLDLPQRYVAMKWYDRATFPLHDPAAQAWVRDVAMAVAAQTPVVLLTGTPETDDHADAVIQHPNIIMPPAASPEKNLEQQIRILAHAEAFVGTYGGMAQLALRLGVPSASFYRQWGGTCWGHLGLSDWLSKSTQVPFLSGSVDDGQAWRRVVSLPAQAAA